VGGKGDPVTVAEHPGIKAGLSVQIVPEDIKDPTDATSIVSTALYRISSSSILNGSKYSTAIEAEILGVAGVYITDTIETMAVTLGQDGLLRLLVNEEFTVQLGVEGAMFVLCHEVYHVLYMHLYSGAASFSDELWILACETIINNRVALHLGFPGLPEVDGKPTGVDPKKQYAAYTKSKRGRSEQPVSFEQFVSTDLACRSYLAEVDKPPTPRNDFCSHEQGEGGGGGTGEGDQEGKSPQIDPEAAGTVVDRALDSLMTRAINGNTAARDALLELGGQLGEGHKIWGDLGLGALRGETVPTAQVRFWEYFLTQAITSVITPGVRMRYPRKMAGCEPFYEAAGAKLPPFPSGDERNSEVSIYIDTSGSMTSAVITRVASLVGEIPNTTVHWRAFDATVYEFAPGDELKGGGGTSFDIIQAHLEKESLEEGYDPDAILVLTDGYAPHIYPADSEKWIWLITHGGDTWPMDKGMDCIEVEI
jgi:predicted metal-dependent peptidase